MSRKVDLEPQDERMFNYWQVQTEFLLNRISLNDVKRLVDNINDSINFRINEDGNIVEAALTPIEREKESVSDKIIEKVEESKQPKEVIEENLKELKVDSELPGMNNQKRQGKIDILEKVIEEIENE